MGHNNLSVVMTAVNPSRFTNHCFFAQEVLAHLPNSQKPKSYFNVRLSSEQGVTVILLGMLWAPLGPLY